LALEPRLNAFSTDNIAAEEPFRAFASRERPYVRAVSCFTHSAWGKSVNISAVRSPGLPFGFTTLKTAFFSSSVTLLFPAS
jgi:hypothetical protein